MPLMPGLRWMHETLTVSLRKKRFLSSDFHVSPKHCFLYREKSDKKCYGWYTFFLLLYFQMLRVQRQCGKARSGALVPLCIKLQGAVLCGKLQNLSDETQCTYSTACLKNVSQEQQSFSPHSFPVCKTELNCEQHNGKDQPSGKFSVSLSCRPLLDHRGFQFNVYKQITAYW